MTHADQTAEPSPEYGFRLFILGAGFSRGAGLPLGNELLPLIIARAEQTLGADNALRADLDRYQTYIERSKGIPLSDADTPFEEFMAFLDVEHYLSLLGKDTWSQDGNLGQILVKKLIGQVIHEATPQPEKIPAHYIEFASNLRKGDILITLNYDILLERALARAGRAFRRFPYRYKSATENGGTVDDSRDEVLILKLHGSVDWVDRSTFDHSYNHLRKLWGDDVEPPPHSVFGRGRRFDSGPLVEGPRPTSDSLSTIEYLKNPNVFYSDRTPSATPLILSPSHNKLLWSKPLMDFWWGMAQAGHMNLGLCIIGYSLPEYDLYMHQILYQVSRNYLELDRELQIGSCKKGKIRLVDFREPGLEREALRKSYMFLDWDDSEVYFDGFCAESLEFVFTPPPLSPSEPTPT